MVVSTPFQTARDGESREQGPKEANEKSATLHHFLPFVLGNVTERNCCDLFLIRKFSQSVETVDQFRNSVLSHER